MTDPYSTLTHYQLPYSWRLWSAVCTASDRQRVWCRTHNPAEVTCPRCLYYADRTAAQGHRPGTVPHMPLPAQRRWVQQEIARCQRCLATEYVQGDVILEKAAEDLALLLALLETLTLLDERQLPLVALSS